MTNAMVTPVAVSSPEYDRILSELKLSYPNVCVLYIDHIKNDELEANYLKHANDLHSDRDNENVEGYGWHGTLPENINAIVGNGFDPKMNKRSVYGQGTYIARLANYSKDYAQMDDTEVSYMFYCKYTYNKLVRPLKPCSVAKNRFIAGCDNVHHPQIYVFPSKYAVIPMYIVAFHKNAV